MNPLLFVGFPLFETWIMMSMKPIATTMLVSDVPVVARNVQNVPSWFLDGPVLESRSNEIPTSLKKEDRV